MAGGLHARGQAQQVLGLLRQAQVHEHRHRLVTSPPRMIPVGYHVRVSSRGMNKWLKVAGLLREVPVRKIEEKNDL